MAEQLSEIATELRSGGQAQPVTTRQFLSWFNAQRRGYWIVRDIRRRLKEAGLQTIPDFEGAYIDAPIRFTLIDESPSNNDGEGPETATGTLQVEVVTPPSVQEVATATLVSKDPTYRISKLAAANQSIVSIKPNGTLAEAVTILMARDFSQLPVMTSEREVKGVVSWRSIGSRLALSNGGTTAQDLMEPHHEIRSHFSIFDAIPIIVAHQYVLVRGDDNRITGIITASDLSSQFRTLAEPFLLLGEIENLVRAMIADRFSAAELLEARDPSATDRDIQGVDDLNFGEYIRLLENPDRWKQFSIQVDRVTFCKDLDRVRQIRNDVMHFDPDGVPSDDLDTLRYFTNFLKQIQAISARV